MLVRSVQPVPDHPYTLHLHVLTTSNLHATVAIEGYSIEVYHGQIPFKEIDDLEIAIRTCPLIQFDIAVLYFDLNTNS